MVRLYPPGKFGNGFVVYTTGDKALIMTCEHVVHGLEMGTRIVTLFSEPHLGPRYTSATLLFADEVRDLALLRFDGLQHRCPSPLGFFEAPTCPGMDVVLLAFFSMHDSSLLRPGTFGGKIM